MKEYLPKKYVFVLCVSLLIFFAPSAFASHAVGIDLTYSCLGGNQYEFTVNFYRDCAGIGAPTVATISISSASCGISTSVDLPLISSQEVSAICPAQQGNSTCNGGSLPGIEQYVYRGTYTFPAQCSDWVIGYTMCCRNSAITNLQSPDSRNIYVQANLNNTAGLCNNSPFFTSLPVPYLCSGQPFFYNHGAVDLDGDSLVYTLVNALDGPGVNIPYNGGRTPTSPLNTTGPFGFDTQTGQMSFTPSGTQQAVVTVLVQEYRNGVLIGSTIRDLQLVVINCTNNLPTATGIDGSGNFSVSICAGYPLCFNIYTNDIDANQTTTINWNGGIQGGSFSATGSPFQTGTFCWTPTIADIGPHNFSVEVSDNACPIPGLNIYNYNVYVVPNPNPPINAGPDVSICQGNCTNLNATTAASGPIVYSWYPTTGLSCTNCPNPTACPSVTTIYTVTATYPDACASTDEVQVTVNPTPTVSVYPTSASICSGGSITLSASGSPTAATYTWNPGGLSGSTVTVSPSANTTYTVTAYDATGCPSLPATSVISLNPPPPSAVCNNIYVTTTGTGGGLSPTDPTSLANALTIGACNNVTIKMAIGTYYINSAINNITSYMTLEGGFDPTNNWAKSSQPGLTTIYRNDNNYDGPANAQRLVAIYLNTLQYVRFQDITIQTANVSSPSASGYGVSNYGVHLTACSNYDFVRTQIICGNASGGANGADYSGQRAASGSNGSAGTDGSDVSCNAGTGGAGGGGASGANAGAAGSAGITPGGCPASNGNGGSGGTSTSYRDGGGGGGGGGGGRSDGNGGQGGNGGGVNGGGGTSGGGGGAGVSSAFASVGGSGANGANGANGASGGNGANGTPGLFSGGFYTPGAQGGNGGDGQGGTGGGGGGGGGGNYCSLCGNPDASGNGGGGGGGGGQGGLGGGGGYGGGAPIAVYLYNNGANSNFTDCNVTVGASGAGGTGGAGMLGGFAGVGGPGSVFGSYAGNGGNGGNGGAGGNGGTGGSAYGGSAVLVYQDGGAAPNTQTYGFALSGQPVINVSNVSCTNNDVTFSAANSSNWSYGSGSNPSTGSGASVITQYTTTGRKDVVFSANNYAGFANIAINNATFLPDITTSALPTGTPNTYYVCAGSSVNFYSSTLATTYAWDMGGGTTPNTYSTQNVLGAVFNTPGTYIISLQVTTDCCGLSNPNSITLIVEPYPTITLSGDSIICEGESTTITASGAVTYSWSPNLYVSATSGSVVTFNPPVTTTYVITGYNTSGNCTFTRNLTITVNANPILNTSTVSATCSGNGSATVVASAGSGSYTYAWNDPAAQITATAINLASGNYGVTVTDANTGCQNNTFAFVAAVGTPIVYIQNSVNVACFGGSTGRATAAGTNGTTPYSYAWSNGPFTALNSNLAAGSYTVTLTDANGCSATVSVSISQPDSLFVAAIDSTPVSCYGGNNGSATVLADGGQGGYSYAWNTSPVQTGTIATGLTAGTYTAVVLDGAGCTATTTVTINTPTALSLTTNSITNLTCFNANDGAIDVTGSGGTPPYTYALNGGPSQPTGQFSSLAAATYTLTLTDANGCDSNFTVIVTQPAQLSLSLVQDSVECFGGSDGAITATANGGTSPYQYAINGGPLQVSNTFGSLAVGNYSISVEDANGCSAVNTIDVLEPTQLSLSLVQDSVECFGGNDGSITATGGGGSLPYEYSINGGAYQSSNVLSSLSAGNYTVTIRDGNGCTVSQAIDVLQPTQLTLALVQDSVECFGGNDGSITATGGGGSLPYEYSINGGTYQSSNVLSSLSAGNYTVTIRDGNGCTVSQAIDVLQPSQLTLALVQDSVECFGGNDGSITATGGGGSLPYEYAINGGAYQPSGSFGTLTAGNYSITIRDGNGCTVLQAIDVLQPAQLTLALVQDSVECFGGNDGSITATGGGGSLPYEYAINGGAYQSSNLFPSLVAANYSITVRDGNGCTALQAIDVLQPTQLTLALVQDSVECFGGNDGSITATGGGGSLPYEYSINGGAYQSSNVLSSLSAGNYTVTIRDGNGCTVSQAIDVLQPTQLTLALVQDSVECFGGNDGSITATGGGGSLPYEYSINGGTYQSSNVLSSLSAGNYTVTIRDGNGCTVSQAIDVLQPSQLTLALVQDSVECFGGNDGSIIATGGGGSLPYEYAINGGAYQPSGNFGTLTAGNYSITIRDGNGCTATQTIDVLQPAQLTLALVQDSVECFGGNDGSITATGGGGSLPYEYAINGGAYQSSNLFPSLVAANYSITVRDGNGCTATQTVDVLQPSQLSVALVQDSVECFGGNDGAITATGAGGSLPYEYSINGGAYQSSNVLSSLSAGNYTVTIRDGNNCTASQTINVWQPTQLSINLSQDSVNCFGAADGSVTASAAGGSLPYEYSINGGTYQSSGSFLGLNAGNYTLRVRDANGCIASGTISVLQPSAITTVVSQLSPVSCFGGNDGSASVLAASGSPGYTYLWSNGNTGATANNLPAGFVRVTVTDAHACIRIDSVNITQPTQISITALLSNVTCYGQANGAISVAASGGVPGYSYSWIPSGTGASIGQLPPAVYTVRVTDASGCSKDSSFTITQPADLTGTITSIDITCFGANDGSASVTASGGVAPYSYLWDNGQTTPTATLFTPGTHSMVIRDANGCTEQLTVQIASPSQLEIVATPNNPICAADSNGTISVIATGGTGTYVYLWSHNDTLSSDFADSLRAGIYSITCVDANNCTAATGTNLTDPASVSVSVTVEDTALIFGESSQLLAVPSSNISGAPVYSWSPTDNLNCIDCADPIAGPLVTDATYEVIMTDANGCLAKAKVNLVVDIYSRLLAVPNAFTPNNDGSNPTFNAYGYGYKTFTMKVFNRWGEKVFESNDQNVGWDGYYKGELQLPGVYAYLVEVEYLDGKKAMKKGSVTLLR